MFWCRMGGGGGEGGFMGHVWFLEYPSSQLGMGVVGQNESGGVKQYTGHFY